MEIGDELSIECHRDAKEDHIPSFHLCVCIILLHRYLSSLIAISFRPCTHELVIFLL